jgi:SAM-dependent methyltransferase
LPWYKHWFNEDYLQLYPHRDEAEAERCVTLIRGLLPWRDGWRALDVGCGAGRHARALEAAGARAVGVDLSMTLLQVARTVTSAPLVRADMRALPVRRASMDLVVNLFTSFGYFASDDEHAAALEEMCGTLRPGGWFVIDYLNAANVRATLVAEEHTLLGGVGAEVTRTLEDAGGVVVKRIVTDDGRRFRERVRLFSPDELTSMLERCGVRVRHRVGDYAGGALDASAPRAILMGTRQ